MKFLPPLVFVAVSAVAVSIWIQYAAAPNVTGQVETVQANLTSAKAGQLTQFHAGLNQPVHAGDVLAVLVPDPKVLERSLAVIRAEIEQTRLGITPTFTRERIEYQVENYRLRELEARTRLAQARIRRQYTEGQFKRVAGLYHGDTNDVVSLNAYEIARRDADSARAEVEEETHVLTNIQDTLQGFGELTRPLAAPADAIQAAINVEEKKLDLAEAELGPTPLVAPIDGVISVILHRDGENVSAGDAIVTITATAATRIVAYVPQPMSVEPVVGMPVKVTSRSLRRATGIGRVESVGAWMGPTKPVLLPQPASQQFVQIGLPVWVSVPPGLKVRPGELVALDFNRAN